MIQTHELWRFALYSAAFVGNLERDPAEVVRVALDLIELSTNSEFCALAGSSHHTLDLFFFGE